MIPELGQFALVIALGLAFIQATLPLLGAWTRQVRLMALARSSAFGQLFFVLIAFACLVHSFVNNDFSVLNVANNSNSALPLPYRIAAVWGNHEGSLLLWSLILAIWTVAVAMFSRSLPRVLLARVLGILGWICVGFLSFMLFTSNPFERIFPAPLDGRDLNPLLQDPGLVIHPPMLYIGYVGFSVAFAFAVAALMGGRMDAVWCRWARPWTTVAWLFLTIGIALGSWWAYYELGWGGWWFWDPVENASFLPWLAGTALIHSLSVTEKRGALKHWTVLLAICAFALSLLGTFLVRSGVLVSVHAFATDPARGSYLLALFGILIGGALTLYAFRASSLQSSGRFALWSREFWLVINNIFLIVATASVLLGTLYPLAIDALGLGKVSVGPPMFNLMFVPLMLPLLFAMGFGAAARWKKDSIGNLFKRMSLLLVLAVIIGAALPWLIFGQGPILVMVGSALAIWAVVSALWEPLRRWRHSGSLSKGMRSVPQHLWGMIVAHLGVGITVLGVTFTSAFSIERDVLMRPGERLQMSAWEFTFRGVTPHNGPNYDADRAEIVIARDAEEVARLFTEKRIYRVQKSPMTEAGIDAGLFRDLYVSLGEPLLDSGDGAWSVKVQYKPFVRWIWLGAIFMALGGLLAATDRRYRLKPKTPGAPPSTKPVGAGNGSDSVDKPSSSDAPSTTPKAQKNKASKAGAKGKKVVNPAWKVQPKYVSNNGPRIH